MLWSQRLWPRLWSNWVAFIKLSPPERFGLIVAGEQCCQVIVKQIADPLHRQIGRETPRGGLQIVSVLTLAREYGRYTVTPDFLDRVQDARLVIHQNIARSRVTALDVIQGFFLVNVNEHLALYSFEDARAFDLPGQKHYISIREDDGLSPRAKPLEHIERSGIQTIGE